MSSLVLASISLNSEASKTAHPSTYSTSRGPYNHNTICYYLRGNLIKAGVQPILTLTIFGIRPRYLTRRHGWKHMSKPLGSDKAKWLE